MSRRFKSKRRKQMKKSIFEVCCGCRICKYKKYAGLTFHHIDPNNKKKEVSDLLHLPWNNDFFWNEFIE